MNIITELPWVVIIKILNDYYLMFITFFSVYRNNWFPSNLFSISIHNNLGILCHKGKWLFSFYWTHGILRNSGVSISTNDRRNASATLLRAVAYFFLQKRSNVVNKRYIIISELKRKLIMMSFQGPLICHALVTPEALLFTCNIMIINVLSCYTNSVFQSIFFSVSL